MNTSFELIGKWWLPETPQVKVAGTLSFLPGKVPRLKLMGALNNPQEGKYPIPQIIKPEIIFGVSSKGERVTLLDCDQINRETSFGDEGVFNTTGFVARYAFVGEHFSCSENIDFSEVSISYHGLDRWYNNHNVRVDNPDIRTKVITIQTPEPITISIEDISVRIVITNNTSLDSSGKNGDSNVTLQISKKSDNSIYEYLHLARLLQYFITLLIDQPTYILEMHGVENNSEDEADPEDYAFPTSVKIYFGAVGWQSNDSDIFTNSIFLPFSEIEDVIPDMLANWLMISKTLKPVFDLFFARIYREMYPENVFLNLTQAIETYHRSKYGGKYEDDDKYLNNLYKKFEAVIPVETPKDYRSSLISGKLRYANEYSLRKRILFLTTHISEIIPIKFVASSKSRNEFSQKVTDTRNYLTHYSPELKLNAAFGKEIYELNKKLELVLEICLFENMGLSDERIKRIIGRDRKYYQYGI